MEFTFRIKRKHGTTFSRFRITDIGVLDGLPSTGVDAAAAATRSSPPRHRHIFLSPAPPTLLLLLPYPSSVREPEGVLEGGETRAGLGFPEPEGLFPGGLLKARGGKIRSERWL
jgi:hypothetical protein